LLPLRNLAPEVYRAILDALDDDRECLGEEESSIDELVKYARAETHVLASQDAAQQVFVDREMQQTHREDIEAIDEDTRLFDAETCEMAGDMRDDHERQREALHRRHQEEISAHLAMWKSKRTLSKYSRASLDLIVRRQQFELYMKNRDYANAQLCANEIHQMEGLEASRAGRQIKSDFRESLRLLRMRQTDEVVALDEKLKNERELFMTRRETDRQVFVNVKKKLNVKQHSFRDAPKAWALTRVTRMNSISKPIPLDEPHRPVSPATPSRASIRSTGRFQRQAQQITLPHLDFTKF
jgi:hypothetical protein